MLVSSTIPNFVNGISQQPPSLRLSSQGELQENAISTVSSGLRKRPPTEHICKISSSPLSDAVVHMIDRDSTEQYQVLLSNGNLAVYDLAGNAKTVNFTNQAYLNTALPATESFAMTTVADYSFISNKTVTVAVGSTRSPARAFEALINVKLGNYGKTYSILINNIVRATYATPDGSTAAHSVALSTDTIANNLIAGLQGSGLNTAPWVCTRHGSTIYIKNTTTDFTVTCEDGFNSNAMVAIKGNLQKFTDLPSNPRVDSFIVQIVGDQASSFDNYWVKYDAGGGNDAVGVWKETIAPGILLGLDANTLPHVLIRESDGTFTFRPASWEDRTVGDLNSNADPSCVGGTINDVFFFQNRLGLLSDENYIQTETGKYFNLYRTTVVALLDSDPVDVTAATNKVAILEHAVSFNKQLLLFSRQQQFMVDSTELMSSKRVPIKPTTDFSVNTKAKPVPAGRNVYFTMNKGQWSSVSEYYVDTGNFTNDASDITSHVPLYVPSNVTRIASGGSEDTLVLLSEDDNTKLYIYKYYFSNNEKLQSSWGTFNFNPGGTILGFDFIRSTLYLVISRAEGVFFEKMDFSVGSSVVGEPYPVKLDRKVQLAIADLTFDGTHTIIDPAAIGYLPDDGDYIAVSKNGTTIKPGGIYTIIYSGGVTKILGDVTSTDLVFGAKYMFRYTLSPLTLKLNKSDNGGRTADALGRTQVRKVSFNHADTGYYQVLVTPVSRQAYTYTFSGKVLGALSASLGVEVMSSGKLGVPVMSQNTAVAITMESNMPLPVALVSADWEAFYVKRSRSV